jgi:hypothetical protein
MNGVIGCYQPRCWLTNIELLTKPSCGQNCCIGTPTCVANVLSTIGCKEVMNPSLINHFSLSSINRQFLNSCPTCWQYAHDDVILMVGCMLRIGIHWSCGCLMVSIIGTFN